MISTDSQASLQVYPFALNRLLHEAPGWVVGHRGWLVDDPSGSSRSNPSNSHVLNSTLLGAQRICTGVLFLFGVLGGEFKDAMIL